MSKKYNKVCKEGHYDYKMTLDDIGKEMGITGEAVRQIEVNALKKIKKLLSKKGITKEILYD